MEINYFVKMNKKKQLTSRRWYIDEINIIQEEFSLNTNVKFMNIKLNKDIYFSWWAQTSLISVLLAKLLGKKSIVVAGGSEVTTMIPNFGYNSKGVFKRWLIKSTLNLCDKIIAVSEFNKSEILDIIGDNNEDKIEVIYHCVSDEYKPNSSFDYTFQKYILMITALTKNNVKRKAVLESIKAINKLRKKIPDINLFIIGRKEDGYKKVKETIEKLDLQDNIKILGEVDEEEKIEYLKNAYCYLQPTNHEQFGVAIAEAMACGLPVISTATAAVPEVVGECGVLIKENSESEISNAIMNLYQNESNRNSIAKKARKRVIEKFSYREKKKRLINLIKNTNKT